MLGIVEGELAVEMAGHVEHFQMPIVAQADSLSARKAKVHLAQLGGLGRGVGVKSHVVVGPEDAVAQVKQRARVFNHGALGGAAT